MYSEVRTNRALQNYFSPFLAVSLFCVIQSHRCQNLKKKKKQTEVRKASVMQYNLKETASHHTVGHTAQTLWHTHTQAAPLALLNTEPAC